MNHTTKAEQESILSTARRLLQIGPDGIETNNPEVVHRLQLEHSISLDRARRYAAKAARIARGEMDKKNFIAWRSTDEDRMIIARILSAYPDLEEVTSRAIRKALRYWDEQNTFTCHLCGLRGSIRLLELVGDEYECRHKSACRERQKNQQKEQ